MLGSTFNYVFETQMENLQNGDRFYYLTRTQGLNFLNQLEPNTFADHVMRNTDLGDGQRPTCPASCSRRRSYILEMDKPDQRTGIGLDGNGGIGDSDRTVRARRTATRPANDRPHAVNARSCRQRRRRRRRPRRRRRTCSTSYDGGEHVVLGGTEGNDII